VVVSAIASAVMYRIAYHRGYELGYRKGVVREIQMANFSHSLISLGALQQLRSGDVAGGTRLIEMVCFGSAQIFYKDPVPNPAEVSDWARQQGMDRNPLPEVTRELTQGLLSYRARYRTNSVEWDNMERKLEIQLAKMK